MLGGLLSCGRRAMSAAQVNLVLGGAVGGFGVFELSRISAEFLGFRLRSSTKTD